MVFCNCIFSHPCTHHMPGYCCSDGRVVGGGCVIRANVCRLLVMLNGPWRLADTVRSPLSPRRMRAKRRMSEGQELGWLRRKEWREMEKQEVREKRALKSVHRSNLPSSYNYMVYHCLEICKNVGECIKNILFYFWVVHYLLCIFFFMVLCFAILPFCIGQQVKDKTLHIDILTTPKGLCSVSMFPPPDIFRLKENIAALAVRGSSCGRYIAYWLYFLHCKHSKTFHIVCNSSNNVQCDNCIESSCSSMYQSY